MDKVLKQRLVGAAILILLAVIFVPMLFDGPSEREALRDTAIELPPPPADRREVRRLPLDPERARETVPSPPREPEPAELADREIRLIDPDSRPEPDPVEPPVEDSAGIAERVPESEPEQTLELQPEPGAEPERTDPARAIPTAQPASGAWVVQVASFGSAETADRVMEQLGRLGHEAGVDVLVRGDTRLHRLRTGPYRTEAEAEQARAQIATTVSGVEPVVRQAAGGSVPAGTPGQGLAVQVGSFAAQANADRLLEQLSGQGFEAFIHADESGSRPIWRVRVGTVASRDEAVRLQRELLERASLEGLIVSHP